MSDWTFLWVTFLLVGSITLVSIIGMFASSPVFALFASVFGTATVLVGREIWERR